MYSVCCLFSLTLCAAVLSRFVGQIASQTGLRNVAILKSTGREAEYGSAQHMKCKATSSLRAYLFILGSMFAVIAFQE